MKVSELMQGGAWAVDRDALQEFRALADLAVERGREFSTAELGAMIFGQAGQVEATARGDAFAIDRGVAIVPVHGLLLQRRNFFSELLGWATYEGLREIFAELAARSDVRAVVLHCHTPGGAAHGVAEVRRAMAAIKVPTYAIVDRMAASAGYWIASGAGEISLDLTCIVGSIGVVAGQIWPVAPDHWGDQAFIVTSSHAGAKRPDPRSEEGRAVVLAELDALEAMFHADAAAGRGIEVAELLSRAGLGGDPKAGGAPFIGADAIDRGLADKLEAGSAALARIMDKHAAAARPAPRAVTTSSAPAARRTAAIARARARL